MSVRGRKKPIDILFNLEHQEGPPQEVVEVLEDEDSPVLEDNDLAAEEERDDDEAGADSVLERLKSKTFVVATRALAQSPQWVSVSHVFKEPNDTEILKRAGVKSLDDTRYAQYTSRLARLRKIKDYPYVMQMLERELDYQEVAEIFVRVNSLGVKLRGSDLALAQNYSTMAEFAQAVGSFPRRVRGEMVYSRSRSPGASHGRFCEQAESLPNRRNYSHHETKISVGGG